MSTFDKVNTIGVKIPVTPEQVPWVWGQQQPIQAKREKFSQNNIHAFQRSAMGNYTMGTVNDGGTIYVTSTIAPASPHAGEALFAIPYVGLFIGTSPTSNGQIFPTLGTANGTQIIVQGGLDFEQFNGTVPAWSGYIINHSGVQQIVGINTNWQYLWFNSGTTK